MGEMRNTYEMLVWEPEGKRLLEDLGLDGGIILKWILEKTGLEDVNWIHLAGYRDL
jgi:hypothetical protein